MTMLLVELFVEELPPKALKTLGASFAATLSEALVAQGLAAADAAVTAYATPRRLAVQVAGVATRAADKALRSKLMPVAVGLDAQGQPTPALLKKLAALGADASALPRLTRALDGKAEALFLDTVAAGVTLADGLQKALADAIARLPIPKVMAYQLADGWTSVHFVRPAHGLVALHGAEIVPVTALGLAAGRTTQGHRFEARKAAIEIADAASYAAQLRDEGAVIAGFAARRAELLRQLQAAAACEGLKPIDDAALLDEVTALVERPNVLTCRFEAEFLAVPQECLILTMKANQKYFPLLDAAGRLTDRFLVVSNISPADASRVIEGNERVVRPRLADAKFFFDQDRKRSLESRLPQLDKVVYHGKLGSQGERVRRVRALARSIGARIGGDVLAQQADRAAQLAKADLLTDMVGEFPELQGIMGGYYARHDGETEAVAQAVEDHYRPRYAGDDLPRGEVGVAVALADKLETLAGLFGIGQLPTGDKDPFALRRHALGVIRMLVERALPLDLDALIELGYAAFPAGLLAPNPLELATFLYERQAGQLREAGYGAAEVDAVLSQRPQRLAEVPRRLEAVRAFAALPEAPALASANKRVANILKKSDAAAPGAVDPALLRESAEQALHRALAEVTPQADAAYARGDYRASLQALAALKAPVDAFFDAVMVNADDAALRRNRLALLTRLHAAMNRVADLARLAN
ncbi:MAG: glycine--tRNA ligase subunit beta [Burkholderiales bacterium]|nr:glycine--tRNA ligase subunit beta [Burkholderiales bacterium]MDE1926815.1 glycine--tRNA ligase subunit beta [Burkholderiales bacterium]MDE2158862.1 glycine--tRNA ligase subunit beta [Burkholderiales bacterium]MDE2504312.1 glycine--tRNA ligase subunit beta [Burkholderiales bacterium]